MKLLISALTKLIFGFVLIALMLFLPAWSFDYFGAWLFLGVLFVPMVIMGAVMLIKSPQLLEKRLQNKDSSAGLRGQPGRR